MDQETDVIRPNRLPARDLDAADRRLLGVLVDDATVSYAELGERAGLSAPAAHERVKRLAAVRRDPSDGGDHRSQGGAQITARLRPCRYRGWGKTPELMAISKYPEVEEIHSVAGDTCMLLKVRTEDTRALEGLLARIYEVPGVVTTRSYVVLSTYLERPVQPAATKEWPAPRHMAEPIY